MAPRDDEAHGPTLPATPDPALGSTAIGTGGAAPAAARFAPGTVLAARYELVRFIAGGGMGEVYEARDRELSVTVALKTIRPDRAHPHLEELFRREIQIARKITHPNVCRTFDVGFHTGADGESTMFLTMELLDGETLAQRIHRLGHIPPADALAIVRDVASALSAAHAVDVIHRDLKSGNIMIAGGRAVVMDFGLARAGSAQDAGGSISEPGQLVGTPQYMAPEQVTSDPLTRAADIYALGVVMFEMVTGSLPFEGPNPLAVATRRLTEDAPSARTRRPDLPRVWTDTIARCLQKDPANRFARAKDVVAALTRRPDSRRWVPIVLAAAIAVVGASIVVVARAPSRQTVPAYRSIAVLGFRNASGDTKDAWLSTGLSEMLTTELSDSTGLRVVPADRVAAGRAELKLTDVGSLSPDALHSLRADLQADLVITGSYVAVSDPSGRRLRVDIRLIDTKTGATTLAFDETGTDATLFELVGHAGQRLRRGVGERPAAGSAAAHDQHAALPEDVTAARLYADGLEADRAFDPRLARSKLEAAVAASPKFALAHVALARILSKLNEDKAAEAEARRAFEIASELPPRERTEVEAGYFEQTKDWASAADRYQALIQSEPDNIEDGLGLVRVLRLGNRKDEARVALTELRVRIGKPDPRLDEEDAKIAGSLSDYARQQRLAAAAAEAAQARGGSILVAEARLEEAGASRRLGDSARAAKSTAEALAIYDKLGDKLGIARVRHSVAGDMIDRGDLAGAKREEEAAIELFLGAGDRSDAQGAYTNLAEALQDLGDLGAARARYEQARELAGELGQRGDEAGALLNLGQVALLLGDTARASTSADAALKIFREIHEPYGEGIALGLSGQIARARGDLTTARTRTDEALAVMRAAGDHVDEIEAQIERARIERQLGEKKAARPTLEAAAAACEALHFDRICANANLELARLGLAEASPEVAARDALRAAAQQQAAGAADGEALARAVATEAFIAKGDLDGAKRELTRARELAGRTQSPEVALEVALATAADEAARGQRTNAADELAKRLAEFMGTVPVDLANRVRARIAALRPAK